MTTPRRVLRSVTLSVFFGCAGGALFMDPVVPQSAVAQDVDEGYFYANLAPHGEWFFQADFGWVWHPARVAAGWRPYTEGQWVWADDVGWTWASQEPWGWATYHYGRWYFDPSYGWSWVPGRTWAPAWVSWRVESGFIGWAPLWPVYFDLHPEYRWDRWSHDHDWDRRHNGRDWDRWVFTRDRDFTSDRVGRHAITDRRERDRIFSGSRDVTQYDESRPERIGHSIDRAMVEKATGRPVRAVKIEAADKPDAVVDTKSERIRMFRPAVKPAAAEKTPDRLGLAKEPSREARETDTLRQEKLRLDNIPEADKARAKAGREPMVREKDNERGAGSSSGAEPAAVAPGERDPSRAEKKGDRGPDAKDDANGAPGERKGGPGGKAKADRVVPDERKGGPGDEPDRVAPAERAKREPADEMDPAQRGKPERAPAGHARPDEAAPAVPAPDAQRERAHPQRDERGSADSPQHMRPERAPQQEQAHPKQHAQPPSGNQEEQPAQQKRAQPEGKKHPRPDEPNANDPNAGEPGHGKNH